MAAIIEKGNPANRTECQTFNNLVPESLTLRPRSSPPGLVDIHVHLHEPDFEYKMRSY